MAANKRRKLNNIAELKNISAFAARERLQVKHDPYESVPGTITKTDEELILSEKGQSFTVISSILSDAIIQKAGEGLAQELDEDSEEHVAEFEDPSNNDEEDNGLTGGLKRSRVGSREPGHFHPSEKLLSHLTTINLDQGDAERVKDGSLRIKIAYGEKLVVLGEYGLSVMKGQITILGAVLSPSQTINKVCAPSSHSLPVIRHFGSDSEKAEVILYQTKSKLRSLNRLSPLFAGLWSTSSGRSGTSSNFKMAPWNFQGSSFQILLDQSGDPRIGYHPTVSLPEWNEALAMAVSDRLKDGSASVTVLCGPKSSGKSTFSKLLMNRLLTTGINRETDSAVAFLDLDPGQPEFSPPGQLSLHLISKPNFGPPFSHPDCSASSAKLIRAHSIAAISPASDPDFFLACTKNLLSCYTNMLLPLHYPLLINTPGWILGTGLELTVHLIKAARPTQVIYMSKDGPREALETLQGVTKSKRFLTLPSQPTEYLPRTSAHLRIMQYISYFHQAAWNSRKTIWNTDPITSQRPLEVKYAGKTIGIWGIMFLGEPPSAHLVKDTIDGSVLALVVIDDVRAILTSKGREDIEEAVENQFSEASPTGMEISEEMAAPYFIQQSRQKFDDPLILHSPEEIPYLDPAHAISLDPIHSYTIGLALVRGIDVRQKKLQLLTPVSPKTIQDIRASGNKIILVSGTLDTPAWAYLEAFYKRNPDTKKDRDQQISDEEPDGSGDQDQENVATGRRDHTDSFKNAPWIDVLRGDKGRDIGSRVWRVRRDLGKTSEGG